MFYLKLVCTFVARKNYQIFIIMKLTKIQIENFRSIKSQEIIFDHNCLILVGKNEAGKSNILRAIAAVFGQYAVKNKDKRKKIDNEKIERYNVRAILKLDKSDFDEIHNRFKKKYTSTENIVFKNGKTLLDFISCIFSEFLLCIDTEDNKKPYFSIWEHDEKEYELEKNVYLQGTSFVNTPINTKQNVETLMWGIVQEFYKENQYKCHYWEYNDKFLLPSSIDIATFIENPSNYKSLENIFLLCKRENVKQEFIDAKSQDGDYHNLLNQVSIEVTKTFRTIWKDFKDTSIQLLPDGANISIKIADKAKYSCEDRSEGFKKFISILLMLSTQVRANRIGERDIILIDEPDQSLYPTSAKYLRDELLKIAEKSKVIYSTHSPYMIDSDCIDRHLIIEKKDDVTTIKKQDANANFSSDELLRRAIGTSIFECLQDKNIIFEGWLDKELFRKYCEIDHKGKDFLNIGKVYLHGISGVEALVQLLILANKKFVIVADSDAASNAKKKEFEKNYKEYSECWVAYADVVSGVSTMEDFISVEHITRCLKHENPDFEFQSKKNVIQNIEIVTQDDKERKQRIKNKIVETLTTDDIRAEYAQFIARLKEMVEK